MKTIIVLFLTLSINVFASNNTPSGYCDHKVSSLKLQQQKDHRFLLVGEKNFKTSFPAKNSDGSINVIIEIPAGCNDKWETNEQGVLQWDLKDGQPRVVNYLPYPFNYGMVPGTLMRKEQGGDGDPLDIVVLGPAMARGEVVKVKLLGVLKALDRGEKDDKLISVIYNPTKNQPMADIDSLEDLKKNGTLEIIKLWFANYKGPEKMKILEVGDSSAAEEMLSTASQSKK